MKRGQITFFVILGIVLLALIAFSFLFKEDIIEQASRLEITKGIVMSEEARKVQSDMAECLQELAYQSLTQLGLQGGYLDLKNIHSIKIDKALKDYDGTAYLYLKGQNKVPSMRQIQNELTKDLDKRSIGCKKDYKGLNVDYGRILPKIQIGENKIGFDINLAIEVQKEDTKITIKRIKFEIPIRLGKIISVANEIVEEQAGEVCLSCLAETGFENDMSIDIENLNGDVFYLITDEKSKIRDKNYMFLMANKF